MHQHIPERGPTVARLLFASSLAFAALLVGGGMLEGTLPSAGAAPAEVAAYFTGDAARLDTNFLLDYLAVIPLLVFLGALLRLTTSGRHGVLAFVYTLGTVLFVGIAVGGTALQVALARLARVDESPELLALLYSLEVASRDAFLLATALLAGSAALLVLHSRALPRAVGWLGLLLTAGALFGMAAQVLDRNGDLGVVGLLSILVFMLLWVPFAGIAALVRARRTARRGDLVPAVPADHSAVAA